MTNFFLDMIITWTHIVCGFVMVGVLFFVYFILHGIHDYYTEKRDSSEYHKIKEALNK